MIIVNFKNHTTKTAYGLWQWDYGQVLRIEGLDLPTATEVHFSTQETGGESVTRIGMTKDGVTDVVIPDSLLENNGIATNYFIYAFIYITDETSGQTEYVAKLEVKSRPKPEAFDTPGDGELFREAIKAVNDSAERSEKAAKASEENAAQTEEDKKSVAKMLETVTDIEDQVKAVETYKTQAVEASESAANAAKSAIEAYSSANEAAQSAMQGASSASDSAISANESKQAAEQSASNASEGANSAEQSASSAFNSAKSANQSAESARRAATSAGESARSAIEAAGSASEAAQSAIEGANSAKESAQSALNGAQSAGESAASALKAKDYADAAKIDAEKAKNDADRAEKKATEAIEAITAEGAKQVKAVADKGAEVLQSIPEDFTAQMQSKLDKNQGIENAGKAMVINPEGVIVPGEVTGGDGIPIINTASGESPLVISDSAERVNKGFGLGGNTEQVQTTGVNLFDEKKLLNFDDPNYDKSGDGKGVFYYKFKTDEQVTVSVTKLNKYGEYLCVGAESDGSDAHWLSHKSAATNTFKTLTPKDGYIYLGVNTTLESVENMIRKTGGIMINHGSVAMPYEPYTGGKPSPSPEYQQEIKNVGKWSEEKQKYEVDVKVTGKNLFNVDAIKTIEITDKYNGYELQHLKPGQYTISTENKTGNTGVGEYLYARIRKADGRLSSSIYVIANKIFESVKVDIGKDEILYFYDVLNKGENKQETSKNIFEKYDFMISFGDAPTEYEPYKEQTITLTSDRPITKWDKLVEQDGQIGWLFNRKMALIPKTGWLYNTIGFFYKRNAFPDANISATPTNETNIFTHFVLGNPQSNKGKDVAWLYVPEIGEGVLIVGVSSATIVTAEEFEKYISDKDMKILYELAVPEFVQLPQEEQALIRSIKTYYPTTVITVDGGEVVPTVELTYTADTKNYILNLLEPINKNIAATQLRLLQEK